MEGLLPQKLLRARTRQGLTLREAAARTGVAKETISELERGLRRPHPPTLYKIAQGYGTSVDEFLVAPSEEPVLAGKAEAPQESGLEGWIEKALEEDDFVQKFERAKASEELAEELQRAKLNASEAQRERVKALKKDRAPQGDVVKAERDLRMLQAQFTAAMSLATARLRGQDVSALSPREPVADVLKTRRDLFTGKYAQSPSSKTGEVGA